MDYKKREIIILKLLFFNSLLLLEKLDNADESLLKEIK